jgi:biotin transport system substrate-specific component
MPTQKSSVAAHSLSITNERLAARVFWVLTFAVLTAVGAQVEIPHAPVPFTAQTFFVLLSGAVLGPWAGAASMLAYIALGAAGLPVFSGLSFGFARLLGPTGGYLLAFPVASLLVGWMTSRRTGYWWTLASMIAGLLLVFTMGTVQLWAVVFRDWPSAIQSGFLIFSWWDAVKLIAAAGIAHQYFKKMRPTA